MADYVRLFSTKEISAYLLVLEAFGRDLTSIEEVRLATLLEKYTAYEVIQAIVIAHDKYLEHDDDGLVTFGENIFWEKLPGICWNRRNGRCW
ncbi:MAG TPA: hypothetical protein GX728_04160 [Clostridiaceae bacterium]|nr:hypothetical protein [Clostridiaceae bacterium]